MVLLQKQSDWTRTAVTVAPKLAVEHLPYLHEVPPEVVLQSNNVRLAVVSISAHQDNLPA